MTLDWQGLPGALGGEGFCRCGSAGRGGGEPYPCLGATPVWISSLPDCVTWGRFLNLSALRFLHPSNDGTNNLHRRLAVRIEQLLSLNCLGQGLARGGH